MAGDGIPQQSVIWPYLELTSDVMTQPTTYLLDVLCLLAVRGVISNLPKMDFSNKQNTHNLLMIPGYTLKRFVSRSYGNYK